MNFTPVAFENSVLRKHKLKSTSVNNFIPEVTYKIFLKTLNFI